MNLSLFPSFPAALEREFRTQYNTVNAPIAKLGVAAGSALFLLFDVWDRIVDPENSDKALVIRICVVLVIAPMMLIPMRTFARYMQLLMTLGLCLCGLGVVFIMSLDHVRIDRGLSGVMLALMFNFGFLRLFFANAITSGALIVLAYNAAVLRSALEPNMIFANNFFLIAAFLTGSAVTYLLEYISRKSFLVTRDLDQERARVNGLLDDLYPRRVSERLKSGADIIAESHGEATVFFSDLVGFASLTKKLSPNHLVQVLNEVFSIMDALTEKHGVEKIKTIGDGYMVVSNLSQPNFNSAESIAEFALDVVEGLTRYAKQHDYPIEVRVGISTGQVVSGVIGRRKPSFDLWGDTVNLANRMETDSELGQIQATETTYWRLRDKYTLSPRGARDIKGVGQVNTYYLMGRKVPSGSQDGPKVGEG